MAVTFNGSHVHMATTPASGNPPQSATAAPGAGPPDQAAFTLSRPLECKIDEQAVVIHGLGMRAIGPDDLPLLDQFHGQPIALAQNLVATLCGITVEQARSLSLDDFTMLAADAIWQVEQVCKAMDLPPHFFLQPAPVEQ